MGSSIHLSTGTVVLILLLSMALVAFWRVVLALVLVALVALLLLGVVSLATAIPAHGQVVGAPRAVTTSAPSQRAGGQWS